MPRVPIPFNLDPLSGTPKYRQLISEITTAIKERRLRRGNTLPSIRAVCAQFNLSRDTVTKAYEELKRLGIVESAHGKAYYVASETIDHTLKIFLLMDTLNAYKQEFFNAFRERLAGSAVIDTYFHHANVRVFETLIRDNIGKYGHYVVCPWNDRAIPDLMDVLDPARTLVLDRRETVPEGWTWVSQDFNEAPLDCLERALERIRRYKRFVFFFAMPSSDPPELPAHFKRFAKRHNLSHAIYPSTAGYEIQPGEVYMTQEDSDLQAIVRATRARGLLLGRDVGLISYNETWFKELIGDGITVISTDWRRMGEVAAETIIEGRRESTLIPTSLILRGSL